MDWTFPKVAAVVAFAGAALYIWVTYKKCRCVFSGVPILGKSPHCVAGSGVPVVSPAKCCHAPHSEVQPAQSATVPLNQCAINIASNASVVHAATCQGNTIFGSSPASQSVSVLPLQSQVFAIWPQSSPSDWYLIGPSTASVGNYSWGNKKLNIKTNVSPNGLAAFGGDVLS